MPPKGGLGTGLGAIFGDLAMEADDFIHLPISKVESNADQPRKRFEETALAELSDSIREHGVISPITVRKLESGYYQIIAGERRWRASRMAGLSEVPCRIIEADDRKVMEIALIENLQREDLNPLEEAEGYKTLIGEFGLTQDEAAKRVGKSRPAVANAMRLLGLPDEVKVFLENGELSAGHARAILQKKSEKEQLELAKKVIQEGLSVRQTEVRATKKEKVEKGAVEKPFVNYTAEVEDRLSKSLGRRVKIVAGRKQGRLEIDYYDADDLEVVIKALETLRLGR